MSAWRVACQIVRQSSTKSVHLRINTNRDCKLTLSTFYLKKEQCFVFLSSVQVKGAMTEAIEGNEVYYDYAMIDKAANAKPEIMNLTKNLR